MPNAALELSHAIDLFLYKDRSSYFDRLSVATDSLDSQNATAPLALPSFRWDMQATCKPMLPAFQYISHKLSQRGIAAALIISQFEPYIIPIWPLPRKTQLFLAKVIRKACKKFAIEPCFMTALASVPNRDLPKVFEAYRPDCYIVRRSIVQNEVIFSGEGLTLLSIDNIYTFKQLLCTLSKRDWVANARDVCLSSCVHLLHRINEVYTNPKLSRGYLARVYKEVEFKQKEFDEVTSDHNGNYCTASIKDVTTLEPDYTALSDIAFDWKSEDEDASAVELPDTSILDQSSTSGHELISPSAMSTLDSWETEVLKPLDSPSPKITYPSVRKPSPVPESPLDPTAPWSSPMIPAPLKKRRRVEAQTAGPNSAPLYSSEKQILDLGRLDMGEVPLETPESWSSGSEMTPLKWLESWTTNAPSLLCQNCHDMIAVEVARRFTVL